MRKTLFFIVIVMCILAFIMANNVASARVNVNIWVNPCNTWSNVNCYNYEDNWQYYTCPDGSIVYNYNSCRQQNYCYDCFCNNSCYTPPVYVCSCGTVVSNSRECPRYSYPYDDNYYYNSYPNNYSNYNYNNYNYGYNNYSSNSMNYNYDYGYNNYNNYNYASNYENDWRGGIYFSW